MAADDPGHQHLRESSAETPGAVLWTLEKHGRFIECTLRFDPQTGSEVRMRRSDERSTVRRFDALDPALAHANAVLHALCASGWQALAGARADAVDPSPTSLGRNQPLTPPCPHCHRIDRVEKEDHSGSSPQWFVCTRCNVRSQSPPRRD